MDIDVNKRKAFSTSLWFRCNKPGHKASECSLRFDIRALTNEELQTILEDWLARLDVAVEEDPVATIEERTTEKDFAESDK